MFEFEIVLSDEGIVIGNLLKEVNFVGLILDVMCMIK